MAEFNPITDLMPMDSSEESVDESSEQIKVIRTQLIETRNSVANVLNIIKTKNSLLDRDLDKIKSLNARLQRTIPRIPIMRGKAGVQFGDTIEEEKKKGGLNIPMLPPRAPVEEEVSYKRPFIKQAADIIGNIFNIGLIFGGIKSLFKGGVKKLVKPGNKIIPTPGIGKPIKIKPDPIKIKPDPKVISMEKFLKSRRQRQFSQKEGFAFSSKRFSNIPSAEAAKYPRGINLTYTSKRSNALVSTVRKAGRRNAPNFDDVVVGADRQLATMKESLTERLGQLNPKRDVKQYNDLLRSIEKINKDQSKIIDLKTEFLEKTAQTTAGGFAAKENVLSDIMKNVKKGIEVMPGGEYIQKPLFKFKNRGRKNVNTRSKNVTGNVTGEDKNTPINMFLKSLFEGSKDKVEARPMNNDIDTLNIDTSATNTVIILTDPPIA